MLSKNDKQYLIIGEIGQQKIISSNKDLNKKIESSLKELGLTKNDIILISSNTLKNISNSLQQQNVNISTNNKEKMYKEKYNDLFSNNSKEDYYLFSINNRYEIYKQQFELKFKSQIEQNSFISSKDVLNGGIGLTNGNGEDFLKGGNQINVYNSNNLQKQKIISQIKDAYTNFKSMTVNINSNFTLAHSLINENIGNIYKSLSILNNYYKSQIKNIRINHETLKSYFEEVNNRVLSKDKEINSFFTIKMSLNNKKEIELFELLINEGKIKQLREKINNQINYLKEKIKNKSQKFDDIVTKNFDETNNLSNKSKNVVDDKKFEELKNKLKLIESTFTELNKKYNKYKFENEIKYIQENNQININNNNNNINYSLNDFININNKSKVYSNQDNNNHELYNNNIDNDLNKLNNLVKNIKNNSEDVLFEIKNFITDSIIKKYFRLSSDIFITLDSFESYNKKFKSYINLLENIDKDNYDLLFYINEALKFKYYFNEYERRINYLKDLKKTIMKIKKSLQQENEVRKKFNEELEEYFNGKINDNKYGIQNNIINFFEWDDVKGNFDVYGDKYYNNIEIDEDELNFAINSENKNWRISLDGGGGNDNDKDYLFFEYNSQQEMIHHLNNKIVEYKLEIKDLEKNIENKNNEFKELKYNFDQINQFLNNLNKNNVNKSEILYSEQKTKINSNGNHNDINDNNDIKKSNTIFNPLYDEINEEDSFTNNNNNINNNSISSSSEENQNNNNKIINNNIFLSLEQTYLIKKSFFNYFTNLLSIKNEEYNKLSSIYNNLQMSIEDKYSQLFFLSSMTKINLVSINVGTQNIFVGHSPGIYGCLLLSECWNKKNKNTYTCE